MALEIERKFLVASDDYRSGAIDSVRIRQGYLSRRPESTVRVRVCGERGYLTVKSKNSGMVRQDWEYEIPAADAEEMLLLCDGVVIDKTRHMVPVGDHVWEVDEFHAPHSGLTVAEVELSGEHDDPGPLPPWVGAEVTGDPRYYNSMLAGSAE